MHVLKIALLIALLSLVALFTFQNTESATVRLFAWSATLSVSLLVLATLFSGVFIGMFLSYTHSWRRRRRQQQAGAAEPQTRGEDF
jgi:uncharacterized integral membrane protein